MHTDWDIADVKNAIREWEKIASQILELLSADNRADRTTPWYPHRAQLMSAVTRYRDLCHHEAAGVGTWRADEQELDEIYDAVWEKGDQLVKWLQRMMQ